MFKKIHAVVLILSPLLASSCGIERSKTTDYFTEETYGIALELESSKFSCRSSLSFTSQDKFYFNQYIDGRNAQTTTNYLQLKDGQHQIFQNIYKGARFDFSKSFAPDGTLTAHLGRISDLGEYITLCPEVDYSREENTYEGAAASVIGTLVEFQQYLKKFQINLPEKKLNLYIAPNVQVTSLFKDQKTKYREAMINNAYYDSLNFMMVFLPQGVRDKNQEIPYGGVPLWSIPFVPIHEYAHHIFASKALGYVQYAKEKGSGASNLCFGKSSISSFVSHSHSMTSVYDLYSAFNEGFADLMGYFGNSMKKLNSLRTVTCFENNRDVDSENFYNGEKKELNLNAVSKFIGKTRNLMGTCLISVDYSSIHTIGAIFANGYYRLSQEMKLTEEQTIKILYGWLDLIGKESSQAMAKQASSRDFATILEKLNESARANIPSQAKNFCQSMQRVFPILQLEGNEC